MSTDFLAENAISPELAAELIRVAPANPFCTKAYAEVLRAPGRQVWLLGRKRGDNLSLVVMPPSFPGD